MKPEKKHKLQPENGFTLIEIILVLVAAAVLGALLVRVLGVSLTGSPTPVIQVGDQYQVIQAMERITGEYRRQVNANTYNISTFNTAINGFAPGGGNVSATRANLSYVNSTGNHNITANVISVTVRRGDQSVQTFFSE